MTICLNMIVKDEAKNMLRCLESVRDIVDYYIINDNGSTDGTPEMIKEIMGEYDIEGEVFNSEWVNFGHNREEALQKFYQDGRWDYALIMDADGTLHHTNGAFKNLQADGYMVDIHFGNMEYKLPMLLGKKAQWHWKGPVHNYVVGNGKYDILKDAYIEFRSGAGAKSHNVSSRVKFLKDTVLLEQELEKNPNDSRSMFYLAQSYNDAGVYELAYKYYMKRSEMGGWTEEIYLSLLNAAICKWKIDNEFPVAMFLKAYEYNPRRVEPLFQIMEWYHNRKEYNSAYIFGKIGAGIACPDSNLFLDKSIYEWRLLDSLSVCAYWSGRYEESYKICCQLLESGKLPSKEVERVKRNLAYSVNKLPMEKGPAYYDGILDTENRYENIYKLVGEWASGSVLDIGCGMALLSDYIENYSGFDFSPKRIERAKSNQVWVGDLYTESLGDYDTYVALEVLEHIDDIRLIERITEGKSFIFSVPSFTDPAHLRTYSKEVIEERFGDLLDIKQSIMFNFNNDKRKWEPGEDLNQAYIILNMATAK